MVFSEQQVEDRTFSTHHGIGVGIITGFSLSSSLSPSLSVSDMSACLFLLSLPPRLSCPPYGKPWAALSEAGGRASIPVVFKENSPVFSGKPDELPSTI